MVGESAALTKQARELLEAADEITSFPHAIGKIILRKKLEMTGMYLHASPFRRGRRGTTKKEISFPRSPLPVLACRRQGQEASREKKLIVGCFTY
jgi:hypothetical protein